MVRRTDERGVVVPSRMMIVAIVVVAIAGVMYVATSPGDKTSGAADQARTASSSPSATPKQPLGTISASPSQSAGTSASASPSASASSSPSKKPKPAVKRGETYVQVFNNSGRTGLAGETAVKAEGVGWKVVGSDNWYGTVPASTVYFPDGMKPAARVLARDLGIRRMLPRVAPMRNDRLTVILTSDYTA